VEVEITISDEMMPGVVSLPHGWGHHARGRAPPSRPTTPASAFNALPVEIEAARG
jgi:hypothetical protein